MSDPARALKPRRWWRRLALTLAASLLIVGPWPVDDSGFEGTAYQRRTLDRLDKKLEAGPASTTGSIRIGLADVDLSPTSPRPLAGFIGQIRTPFVGVDSPCLARALSVDRGGEVVTILTADLLLINAKMARAVVERAGLQPHEVYFTSSHTHGGPGGWGDHPLEMLVAGAYDPAYFDALANQLADVVRRSRARLEPAEMAFVEVQARDRQRNRVDPSLPTHDALSALAFRARGAAEGSPPLAILVVFGAHATVSHPVPPRLGGDYPSALVEELKRTTGAGSVLFASGAVGDASPARPRAASQLESARALGKALASDLTEPLRSARYEADVTSGNLWLDVDLPSVRLPFFAAKLRFSPALTWWITDRRTHLHAYRLGPAVLMGFPGDYSGHLADALGASIRDQGITAVPTSFDGDFRGYLVSGRVFRDRSCYETRLMSFFGPVTGDYLNDLAGRMIGRLTGRTTPEARPDPGLGEIVDRIALGVLLGMIGGIELTRRGRGFPAIARGVGWPTVVAAGLAVVAPWLAPDTFAWVRFEAPWWLRLAGLPIGLIGLRRWPEGRSAWIVAIGSAWLGVNWLVVLIAVRGWARTIGTNREPASTD